jgi:hypothetical protein
LSHRASVAWRRREASPDESRLAPRHFIKRHRESEEAMVEYERSRRIAATEGEVFDFISNLRHMPNYLPTIDSAEKVADGRIRLRGKNHGVKFEDDGWLQIDADRHRIEWGNDERTYRGWLKVSGNNGSSQLVAHLSLEPRYSPSGRPLTGEAGQEPNPVEEGLEAAMDSLRNLIEGTGGEQRPATTA